MPEEMTIDNMLRRFTVAESVMGGWHKKIKVRRRLYGGDHYESPPKNDGEHQYVDPTYINVTDIAAAIMVANQVEFRAKTWDLSSPSVASASQVEKLLIGILEANNRRLETSLEYRAGFDFCRDGCAVIYSVWDDFIAAESMDTFEWIGEAEVVRKTGFREVPIRVELIDPMKVYFIPGGRNRWQEVFRVDRVSVFDVEAEYDIRMDEYLSLSDERKMDTYLDRYDYWREVIVQDEDKDTKRKTPRIEVQHAIFLENRTILQKLAAEPGYRQLPYSIQFFKPVSPYAEDSSEWGHSMIDPIQESVKYVERAINRVLRQVDMYTALPLMATANNRQLNIHPALQNQVVLMNKDEDLRFPRWEGNPPDVYHTLDIFRAHTQQASFPNSMLGDGPSSVSGYALSQMTDQGRIRLEQPVHHLELLWEIWAKKAMDILDYFARNNVVRVFGEIGGGHFLDKVVVEGLNDILVSVRVRPKFPNDETRRHSMATQAASFLSQHTLLQNYLDIEQPDDEMDRIAFETLERDPLVQLYSIIHELQRKAKAGDGTAGILLQQALEAVSSHMGRAAQAGAMPGTQGTLANPNTLSGVMSANGQPTPQEQGGMPPGMEGMNV